MEGTDKQIDSDIDPDQEYIYRLGLETLSFAGYQLFKVSRIPFALRIVVGIKLETI